MVREGIKVLSSSLGRKDLIGYFRLQEIDTNDPKAQNAPTPNATGPDRPGQGGERSRHPKPSVLSDFILGSQDGIVNVLGIILGLSAATRDVRIILVATLAALGAESIAMGAVAYTSTRARRRLYLSQALQERREMKEVPESERAEVRAILAGWGTMVATWKTSSIEFVETRRPSSSS